MKKENHNLLLNPGRISRVVVPRPVNISTGLALETQLMDAVLNGATDRGFILWRSKRALVVPRSATHKPGFERAAEYCDNQGWPVIARSTGGELTPQDEGFINLSMVVKCQKKQISIKRSYELICHAMQRWLKRFGIESYYGSVDGAFCDGDFNLVIEGKKIAGTAQRWKQLKKTRATADGSDTALLIHAVIMCDGDLASMWKISNAFYELCDLPPFIKDECHISLGQVMGKSGEAFTRHAMDTLADVMNLCIEEINAHDLDYSVENKSNLVGF